MSDELKLATREYQFIAFYFLLLLCLPVEFESVDL